MDPLTHHPKNHLFLLFIFLIVFLYVYTSFISIPFILANIYSSSTESLGTMLDARHISKHIWLCPCLNYNTLRGTEQQVRTRKCAQRIRDLI